VGLGFILWFGLLVVAMFFFKRKMDKESDSGHWTMFIVVVMVCI
jgi:membrane protein DedA with SNARE-associated domain